MFTLHCGGDAAGVPGPSDPIDPSDPAAPGEQAAATPDAPDAPDTTPPSVVSIAPADGSKGVRADAKIVLTFSEPMDRAATEAAWASEELPGEKMGFVWNEAGTVLTVTPSSPLEYAEVADLQGAAKRYAIAVGAGAKDLAGNAMGQAASSEFFTLRSLFATAPLVPAASGRLHANATPSIVKNLADYRVGDSAVDAPLWGIFTFDVSGLPKGAEVTEATFATRQINILSAPYTDLDGQAILSHTAFATMVPADVKAAAATPIGPLSTDAALGPRSMDVSAAVAADVADRVAKNHRTQFRLSFAKASDGTGDVDAADFLPPELSLKVLVP